MKKRLFIILFILIASFSFANDFYVSKLIADKNGRILEGENVDTVHPLASVTKLMSVLVAVDKVEKGIVNYDDMVTISRTAAYVRGSFVDFPIGEKHSLSDLLKLIIVYSGNDATYAVAEFISGTEEKFVEEMNKKAQELGMTNTTFYTSTGLPPSMTKKPESHVDVSTTRDIALLAAEALRHEKYIEYASLPSVNVTINGKDRKFLNRNNLLKDFKGVDGLKTGHHSLANYNIAVSALKDDLRLILVLFGFPNEITRDNEGKKMLNYGYSNYKNVKIGSKGEFAVRIPVKNAKEKYTDLVFNSDLDITIYNDWEYEKIVTVPPFLEAPLTEGEVVGIYSIKCNNEIIAETNIILNKNLEKLSWFRKILRFLTFGLF